MRDELKNMKKEMSHISVHDEFAKYARLQRKFNQVNNTLNEKSEFLYFFSVVSKWEIYFNKICIDLYSFFAIY